MSGCDHPYDSVVKDTARMIFEDSDSPISTPEGKTINVQIDYCTECEEIIAVPSFQDRYPLSRLNTRIQTDDPNPEDCLHPYESVEDRVFTFIVSNPIPDVDSVSVKYCHNCNTVIDQTENSLDLLTL